MKKFLYILLLLFSVSSCLPKIDSGKIVAKHYEPEMFYMTYTPVIAGTNIVMMPQYHIDREDYVLHVKGIYNDKEIVQRVYTTKECYNSYKLGDKWIKSKNCEFRDFNNHKLLDHEK